MLDGMVVDLGDVVLKVRLLVKGRRLRLRWHVGAPTKATPADRDGTFTPVAPPSGKVDHSMDLQADKKVTFTLSFTDEMGNPTDAPVGMTATFSVDAPSVLALTDHGDGTATVAATGELGSAVVHADVTAPGLAPTTGDEMITVVPGGAERVALVAGTPEEVTPDTP